MDGDAALIEAAHAMMDLSPPWASVLVRRKLYAVRVCGDGGGAWFEPAAADGGEADTAEVTAGAAFFRIS